MIALSLIIALAIWLNSGHQKYLFLQYFWGLLCNLIRTTVKALSDMNPICFNQELHERKRYHFKDASLFQDGKKISFRSNGRTVNHYNSRNDFMQETYLKGIVEKERFHLKAQGPGRQTARCRSKHFFKKFVFPLNVRVFESKKLFF